MIRVSVSSLCIVLVACIVLACDPGHSVTYENRTDETVEVLLNGRFNLSLGPGETETVEEIEFDETTFSARTSDGRVIYEQTFTWDELREADWRIIITAR